MPFIGRMMEYHAVKNHLATVVGRGDLKIILRVIVIGYDPLFLCLDFPQLGDGDGCGHSLVAPVFDTHARLPLGRH